jgi:hypothetical protein
MHVHLPKPLHGWREFAGEVGIIVLGVLIALTAEQVIEALHWRNEVAKFRSEVRQEVAIDLGTYKYRLRENGCVNRRLDELERWLDGWRSGRALPLAGPIGAPASLSLETAVWQNRDPNVMSHMPAKERIDFGDLYDKFANNETHRLDERETWLELAQFDGATALDHGDLVRLRALISRARYRDERLNANASGYFDLARTMGITPHIQDDAPAVGPVLCRPILGPADSPSA